MVHTAKRISSKGTDVPNQFAMPGGAQQQRSLVAEHGQKAVRLDDAQDLSAAQAAISKRFGQYEPAGHANRTFAEFGKERLIALCQGMGFDEDFTRNALALFKDMTAPWGHRLIGNAPAWHSRIGEDHTPYEFSMTVGGEEQELRILVEAQAATPTLSAYRDEALALTERLERLHGASLERLRLVQDLFLPENPQGEFVMWHAASLQRGRRPEFKVYLNPQAHGKERVAAVLEEALCRLGFTKAWRSISRWATARGPHLDELKYFSLDLTDSETARVKIYLRHHDITAKELEYALSAAEEYEAGDATGFCTSMLGHEGPYSSKPVTCWYGFVDPRSDRPKAVTVQLPVSHLAPNDRVVAERVRGYLKQQDIPVEQYERPLEAFARRPLEHGVGMQSYVSFRREGGTPRLCIYLSPEAYEVLPPMLSVSPVSVRAVSSPADISEALEQTNLGNHPYFQRMRNRPVNLSNLWLLFTNSYEGIIRDYTHWLAKVTARVEDIRARCVLAKLLNEELGDGNYDHVHQHLFTRLVECFERWRPRGDEAYLLAPGRSFRQRLTALYANADQYMGVGATLAMETYGKHANEVVVNVLKDGREATRAAYQLLKIHADMEGDHADEVFHLGNTLLPSSGPGLEAAWAGAQEVISAFHTFLSELDTLAQETTGRTSMPASS